MITDPVPKIKTRLAVYSASDKSRKLDRLPDADTFQHFANAFSLAIKSEKIKSVRTAGDAILAFLAEHYKIPAPVLKVLGSRPLKVHEGKWSFELFGDYDLDSHLIRIWMRTAVQKKVTSYRGLLNTLLHEFCHHLDLHGLGFSDTPHTRGFYHRVDDLYHCALATPKAQRPELKWIKSGSGWRIDWNAIRAQKK